MNPTSPTPWSQTLQEQTREALENNFCSPIDGFLHLKHKQEGYAKINMVMHSGSDWLVEKASGSSTRYSTTDALISAGWAID
jgi:hypothetical protein